jgi:hypothetical protein
MEKQLTMLSKHNKVWYKKKKALKQISKINFKRETIFSKNLVAIHMNKQQIKFNIHWILCFNAGVGNSFYYVIQTYILLIFLFVDQNNI